MCHRVISHFFSHDSDARHREDEHTQVLMRSQIPLPSSQSVGLTGAAAGHDPSPASHCLALTMAGGTDDVRG